MLFIVMLFIAVIISCHSSCHVIPHYLSSVECFPCHSLMKVAVSYWNVRKSVNFWLVCNKWSSVDLLFPFGTCNLPLHSVSVLLTLLSLFSTAKGCVDCVGLIVSDYTILCLYVVYSALPGEHEPTYTALGYKHPLKPFIHERRVSCCKNGCR